jgi:FixJ family two-component response regulator
MPVIFITASDDLARQVVVRGQRAVYLLRKPFSSNDLLDAVGAALRPSEGRSEYRLTSDMRSTWKHLDVRRHIVIKLHRCVRVIEMNAKA